MLPHHKPFGGDPCKLCGCAVSAHVVPHHPAGNPCQKCNLPASQHAPPPGLPVPETVIRQFTPGERRRKERDPNQGPAIEPIFMGIDGEGQGREHHAYVFLGVSSSDNKHIYTLEDPTWRPAWRAPAHPPQSGYYADGVMGLSTVAVLDFLLTLPRHAKLFAFSFGYDLTKILTDVDDKSLYRLFRPELRPRKGANASMLGPKPVKWNGYELNLQGSKFTVAKEGRKITIWDVFKFFGTKFVTALKTWKVGAPSMWAQMQKMKEKRGEFDREPPEDVIPYCLEECRCMAEIALSLTQAHDRVELPLKAYHGAGSSAAAMLKKMNVKDKIVEMPKEMLEAIARAFFGGRFENSAIGPIRERLWGYDISSAYPYQLCFLPCLLHGKWKHTTKRRSLEKAPQALIRYGFNVGRIPRKHALSPEGLKARGQIRPAWGPFPYRFGDGSIEKGSICFPWTSPGGWVYLEEYLAGEKLFPHVTFEEAWVYESQCNCDPPFSKIPFYYLYRVLVGKDEGPGLTIKLAVNSCYGKLAQSIGNAMFNCWLWAGMITSGCRGQILELMGCASDLSQVLSIATDGLVSRERLSCPKPRPTGTDFVLGSDLQPSTKRNNKSLGGWEEKEASKGMFLARPGVNFPLFPDEDELKDIKGRGVGKGVILHHHDLILKTWLRHLGAESVMVANVQRFCGAKTSISRSGKPGEYIYNRANGEGSTEGHTMPSYGQWITRPVELSFNPRPKREKVTMGQRQDWGTLSVRRIRGGGLSAQYDRAVRSAEATELEEATQVVLEQPDVDFQSFDMTEEIDL